MQDLLKEVPTPSQAQEEKSCGDSNGTCALSTGFVISGGNFHGEYPTKALDYLATCIDQVQNFNHILQLVIVDLVHKVCRTDASQRARFIRCIYNLLDSESGAVRYDAAGTLVTLSSAPAWPAPAWPAPPLCSPRATLCLSSFCFVIRRAETKRRDQDHCLVGLLVLELD